MIDFYTWRTPNGQKIAIMLEEIGLPYQAHFVDLTKGDQFKPDFLKINPNNKIPAIVDRDGPGHQKISVFESGAILIYLADKTGKFLSINPRQRIKAVQWLMFQVGGVGPMLGQVHHFLHHAKETVPYGIERYTTEGIRIYKVMNEHLAHNAYFADEYSIADMAIYPWVNLYEYQTIDINEYPHLKRWHHEISLRPAVKKGMVLI